MAEQNADLYWFVTHRIMVDHEQSITEQLIDRAEKSIGLKPFPLSTEADPSDKDFVFLKWVLFDCAAATMFAMMAEGSITEHEWPVKISDFSGEIIDVFFDHIVMKIWVGV